MTEVGYDFLLWKSFPSSLKATNEQAAAYVWKPARLDLPVEPGKTLTVEVQGKQDHVLGPIYYSGVRVHRGPGWGSAIGFVRFPIGTFDWTKFTEKMTIPADVRVVEVWLHAGVGVPKATTLYDDLKIYQDDRLIYANDFSNWNPLIGAGVGAGILGVVVPAVVRVPEPGVAYEYQKPLLEKEPLWAAGLAGLGALVGGGVGLLTALGLVPVPQIPPLPTLEAPPEGARLGTYVVRG